MDIISNHKCLKPWNHLAAQKKYKLKNGENVPIYQLAEVVLAQSNLLNNHYQRKCKVLFTFTCMLIF